MEIYLVGGAVRDELLGLPVRERDWVVVGATADELTHLGYRPVGKDFPVFLHPVTHEEYALARTERKTAPGYKGFRVHAAPEVTLEQDLARRDLTINAMARDTGGRLIDPFGGANDLRAGLLRHVSAAFAEDPVRILRVARFAARFGRGFEHRYGAGNGFEIAAETKALMQRMVAAGEVDALVPERIFAETRRALTERDPIRYFAVLHDCGALARCMPELADAQAATKAIDGDVAQPVFAPLARAATAGADAVLRWAALMAGMADAFTDPLNAAAAIERLQAGLRAPGAYRELALLAVRLGKACRAAAQADAAAVLELLEAADAFRRAERFEHLLQLCAAIAWTTPPAAARLRQARALASAVRVNDLTATHTGPALAAALRQRRLAALAAQPPPA